MRGPRAGSIWFWPLVLSAAFSPVWPQANQDIAFADFQFNRSLPGARSLGLGGAFVAVADDATSAYSNPAGLSLLLRPEVSIEGRAWAATSQFTERGRITGAPTGIGIDTGQTVLGRSRGETEDLSFLSYVHTLPTSRWAFGVYRHTLIDYSSAFNTQGVFTGGSNPRFGPYRAQTAFQVISLGAAVAYEFANCRRESSGCARLGLSVASNNLELASRTEVLRDPPPLGLGEADFTERVVGTARVWGDDTALGGTVGILWQAPKRWTFGIAYRKAPRFSIEERVFSPNRAAKLALPDQLAAGVAMDLPRDFMISFEVDWVRYSSLIEGNSFAVFELNDGLEARLGLERLIFLGQGVTRNKLSLMAGVWFDPDHRLVFSAPARTPIDLFRTAYFGLPGDDELHLSAGLGLNLGRFQLDLAYDGSERVDVLAVSSVFRF